MTTTTLPDPLDTAPADHRPWPQIPVPHTAIRGPAEADHFRTYIPSSRNRWYVDPLPADEVWPEAPELEVYPAISTVKKASGADWSLVALKRAAEEIVKRPDRFEGMDFTDVYETLKGDNERGLRRAAARGTNVHTYFEKGLYGQEVTYSDGPHEPGAEYLPAVREFFAVHQPELIAAEYVAIDRHLNGRGYGGTGDAIATITAPKPSAMRQKMEADAKQRVADAEADMIEALDSREEAEVEKARAALLAAQEAREVLLAAPDRLRVRAYLDWKSRKDEGKHAIYPEEAAQVGAAAGAQYMIVEGKYGAERAPLPEADLGVIVSIRPDGFRVYPIHLDKAYVHWTRLHAWWVARKTERETYGRVWPAAKPTPLEDQIAKTTSREQALLLHRLHAPGGLWTPEHTKQAAAMWPKQ